MLVIEVDREGDGRWIAEVPDLPGVMTCGPTREEAVARVQALTLRVLADRVENGELITAVGGQARQYGPVLSRYFDSRNCSARN